MFKIAVTAILLAATISTAYGQGGQCIRSMGQMCCQVCDSNYRCWYVCR